MNFVHWNWLGMQHTFSSSSSPPTNLPIYSPSISCAVFLSLFVSPSHSYFTFLVIFLYFYFYPFHGSRIPFFPTNLYFFLYLSICLSFSLLHLVCAFLPPSAIFFPILPDLYSLPILLSSFSSLPLSLPIHLALSLRFLYSLSRLIFLSFSSIFPSPSSLPLPLSLSLSPSFPISLPLFTSRPSLLHPVCHPSPSSHTAPPPPLAV